MDHLFDGSLDVVGSVDSISIAIATHSDLSESRTGVADAVVAVVSVEEAAYHAERCRANKRWEFVSYAGRAQAKLESAKRCRP